MFQPQDQIEVGEDGFKQYDGKPGFSEFVCVCVGGVSCVCACVRALAVTWYLICNLHAI